MPLCTFPDLYWVIKQIIHSAAWNPLNIWSQMSTGLTNIHTSWSTPSSSTKFSNPLKHCPWFHSPFSQPLYWKDKGSQKNSQYCTAIIHQQICPLPCVLPFCLLKWWSVFPSVKNSLVWTLDFILCFLFCNCPPVLKLFCSRIFNLSQTINNFKALLP